MSSSGRLAFLRVKEGLRRSCCRKWICGWCGLGHRECHGFTNLRGLQVRVRVSRSQPPKNPHPQAWVTGLSRVCYLLDSIKTMILCISIYYLFSIQYVINILLLHFSLSKRENLIALMCSFSNLFLQPFAQLMALNQKFWCIPNK